MQAVERKTWIDVAKGIGIFLVVLGHSEMGARPGVWIYSFHMPLFFFLSGYLYDPARYTPREFVCRRVRTLLLPYAIFTVVVLLLMAIFLRSPSALAQMPHMIHGVLFRGWANGMITYALWFIPVLFATEVLYMLLYRLPRPACMAGLLIAVALNVVAMRHSIYLPYALQVVGVAIVFYWVGHMVGRCNLVIAGRRNTCVAVAVALAALALNIVAAYGNTCRVDLAYNVQGNPLIMYVGALAGIAAMVILSMLIARSTRASLLPAYLGRNSYAILAMHMTYMHLLLHGKTFPGPIVVRDIIVWLLLFLTIYIINRYTPWILGKWK